MIAGLFAAVVLAAASPSPAPAPPDCPRERVRVVEESNFTFPENARPTHDRVRFLIDLGSDGRIRRSATVESSGDSAVDAAAAKALSEFRFAPPSVACMSSSSVWSQWWELREAAPSSPSPSPSPAATVAAASAPCAAPFVRPNGLPLPRRREAPGTTVIDVALDATARVTGVHLVQSSGNPKTDYFATTAARNGLFVFERQPGCAPVATTYRLELTFR